MAGVTAVLKPFAWLAVFAFFVGFFGYLAVSPPSQASAAARADREAALTSGPASEEWNLPRHI